MTIVSTAVAIAYSRLKYKVIIQDICQPVVNILTLVVVFALGFRLFGAISCFVISFTVSAFIGIHIVKKIFPELFLSFPAVFENRKLLVYSLPIVFIVSSYFFIFEIDKIMLGIFRSVREVGIYSAASSIALNITIFYGIFEASFSPVMAQLYHNNETNKLVKIYGLISHWGLYCAFLPCVCLMLFSREVLSLFGNEFRSGNLVLIILSLAFFLENAFGQARQLLQMSSRQNVEFVNSFISVILVVILNIFLIPRFGMIGASLAIFSSLFSISIVRLIEIRNIFGFFPFTQRYSKFLGFSILVIMVCFISIDNTFIFRLVLAVIIISCFFTMSYILKSKEDVLVLSIIKQRFMKKG